MKLTSKSLALVLFTMLLLAPAASVQACSVCYGDPDSLMAKGAVAGVFVLFGVISSMLMAIVGTGLFWMHRSRNLAKTSQGDQSSDRPVAN